MEGKVALVTGGASGIGRVTAGPLPGKGQGRCHDRREPVPGRRRRSGSSQRQEERRPLSMRRVEGDRCGGHGGKVVETYGRMTMPSITRASAPTASGCPCPHRRHAGRAVEQAHSHQPDGCFSLHEIRDAADDEAALRRHREYFLRGSLQGGSGFSAYDATKTGLFGLTKAAALEGATQGIRVNVICPGPTERTLLLENLTRAPSRRFREKITIEIIPLRRVKEPEEMAEAVIWLWARDKASFVHWPYHAHRRRDDFHVMDSAQRGKGSLPSL